MTGRERMLKALRFEETDRPPHFEVMFELEYEAFGLRFPDRNSWSDCSRAEKERKIAVCMDVYARILERYQWDALAVYWPWSDADGVAAAAREFGRDVLIGTMIGHSIWAIESVGDWMQFAIDLHEHPERVHEEAERRCRRAVEQIDTLMDAGADFIDLVNDVAGNDGPFISPQQFREFVTPYLERQVQRIKKGGGIAFVHTDGMAMPILDELLSTGMDVFQGVDPMAGMDIAEVKRRTYGKCALMGNVQCSLLQHGPKERIRESALYCLEHGSPGGGYIFATSNTIFPGMPLENYEYMLDVFREFTAQERRRR
jgi:uroporphyrinogen decarboxylase